jgi:methionine-rich copper-binding protein CopC
VRWQGSSVEFGPHAANAVEPVRSRSIIRPVTVERAFPFRDDIFPNALGKPQSRKVTLMNFFKTPLIAAIGLSMISTAVFAHAMLQKAEPPVGGTVTASPSEIRMQFSEGVEPKFSGITLATSDGAALPTGQPTVDPQNQSVLVVKVGRKLEPGTYKVDWHAVSVDTHSTEGSFMFSVQ